MNNTLFTSSFSTFSMRRFCFNPQKKTKMQIPYIISMQNIKNIISEKIWPNMMFWYCIIADFKAFLILMVILGYFDWKWPFLALTVIISLGVKQEPNEIGKLVSPIWNPNNKGNTKIPHHTNLIWAFLRFYDGFLQNLMKFLRSFCSDWPKKIVKFFKRCAIPV